MGTQTNKKAVLSITPDTTGGIPTPNFRKVDFETAITRKGYNVCVEKALRCPCVDKASGSALPSCKNCGGTGYFFVDMRKTKLLMHSITAKKQYATWTVENAGTVSITARAIDKMCYMDKITMIDIDSEYNQLITTYKDEDKNLNIGKLHYNPIKIFDVYGFDSVEKPLIYVPCEDYKINGNFLEISPEYQCESFSVRYLHNPVFHIIDTNRESMVQVNLRGKGLENLPANYIGRRADIVIDIENLNQDRLFDNTNYDKVNNCNDCAGN